MKLFNETNSIRFDPSTIVYLTLNKGHTIYSILDLVRLGMSIMLSAKAHLLIL